MQRHTIKERVEVVVIYFAQLEEVFTCFGAEFCFEVNYDVSQ